MFVFQEGGFTLAPPTPSVIKVVLSNTEAFDPTLLRPHCKCPAPRTMIDSDQSGSQTIKDFPMGSNNNDASVRDSTN